MEDEEMVTDPEQSPVYKTFFDRECPSAITEDEW